jgi:hypothetical protein
MATIAVGFDALLTGYGEDWVADSAPEVAFSRKPETESPSALAV